MVSADARFATSSASRSNDLADGYSAVISRREISPEFVERQILLADQLNGAPLPDHALRLVVPGDGLGGRSVRDVVRIEVK